MSSNHPLVDRTEAVYREMRSLKRRFRIGGWLTLIVGGILLLLVATYFTIGYREISAFRDPTYIVSLVGQMVDDQIPTMRQTAEDQVNANASTWAEQASQQAIKYVKPMREQLESYALEKSDEAIAKIDTIGEEKFRKILNENRETVQNAIDQLKSDDEISEGAVLALQEAIETEFQINSDTQTAALVTMVSDIHANMEELAAGENLSREQKAERRVIMLARRFHVDQFGDMTAQDLSDTVTDAIPAMGEYIGSAEEKQLRKQRKKQVELVKPADKPEAKKEAPAEEKPADKPADKPEAKKEAPAEEKPADKPADKPEAKKEAPAEEKPADKPADKPEAKKEAPAEEKPADKPEEK